MQLKTRTHFLILAFLIIAACSGKNQLIRNNHTEAFASSETDTRPKKASVSASADEAKAIAATRSGLKKENQDPEENRLDSIDLTGSNDEAEKPTRIAYNPSLPSLSATATVSATAPVVEDPSLSPAGEETPEVPSSPSLAEGAPVGKKPAPSVADEQEIDFNFDNADIHEVVSIISDILGFNYITDPRMTGVVNIHTKGKISKKDLFPILETLLKINNFTIIKKGEFYHIVPFQTVKQEPVLPQISLDREALPFSDKLVFQVVALQFISASNMAQILQPLMTQGSYVIGMADSNLLIMIEFSANVKKLLAIIDLFDVDVFEQLHVQLYEVINANAEELASDIQSVFQAFELPQGNPKAGGINLLPLSRINMLLAVSSNERLVEKAIQWAQQLDTDVSEIAVKIFVYNVQNGKAANIAAVLTQVFKAPVPQRETTFQSRLREAAARPTPEKPQQQPAPPRTPAQPARQAQTATPSVEEVQVEIVVDEVTNALIIRATERDYRIVEKTIKKLDIYPKQVLIEVLIAEIRLDDEFKMGVEWGYMNEMDEAQYQVDVTGVPNLASEITSGLKYMVDKTDRFKAKLQAFASDDRVNILSSPHIIASDNMEAKIDIAEEIPIVSGKVTTTSAEPVVTETVEYRDTGIILTVTPHINDKGLVTLDLSQEVSELSGSVGGNPTFLKRKAQTSMVVQNGQSVIIGGLIRDTWSAGKQGVPVLSRIPIMGSLFGVHKKTANRSELMLLLTPRVIASIEEADLITREFRDKLSIIEKQVSSNQ